MRFEGTLALTVNEILARAEALLHAILGKARASASMYVECAHHPSRSCLNASVLTCQNVARRTVHSPPMLVTLKEFHEKTQS